ncbi:ATP-dependent helicase HrpB [Pseudopontixanthobacter vadosimaris]|uniref:ATP-dependent helicase HrpB n=1 Tax=Pseudopontixanthobacter vadosimaris TaxID=2726450 RepID=UPI001472F4C7
MTEDRLPIHAALPALLEALGKGNGAVLVAPPGAGKTTAVAPALLRQEWCTGTIVITSPRRVAARAAAERMAEMLGEAVGQTVGYLTRMDSRQSAATRILVMTEAIFVSRIVADADLSGVSAVLFDEAHERHLDSDLGLALALETREILREDLRICVMSATIDGARFASLLGPETPVIESEGKAFPLRIEWCGARPDLRMEDATTLAIMQAWREEQGDILAFLPGVREIERVEERLAARLPGVPILPLHGQVRPPQQRAAIRRDAEGRRRIVLATAIAETSLTLEGVSVVVDSGLARNAEYDKAAGTTRLVTVRASQAAAAQRAGRAARTGPGVAYRLWAEAAHAGRPAFTAPEIVSADLAPLSLSLARWGSGDPLDLRWLDPPPAPALAAATAQLRLAGAFDAAGRLTEFGEKLSRLPMAPAMAAMVLHGARSGAAGEAARIALLLQERGLGGSGEDLAQRLERWHSDGGSRAIAAKKLAGRWARQAERLMVSDSEGARAPPPGILLARAMPGHLARRRDATGEHWASAGGRGYVLDPASPLARAEWLAIGDAQGQAKGARITAALPLTQAEVELWLGDRIAQRSVLRWNDGQDPARIEARVERRLGAIVMATGPDAEPDSAAVEAMLLERACERIGAFLPADLLARGRFAGIAALDPNRLAADAEIWLVPLLHGRRDLAVSPGKLAEAALSLVDWDDRQKLDRLAPRNYTSPAGTSHSIDYTGDDAPGVAVRVQALFGLDRHPFVGDTPLLLKLTSPAGRPIQSTRDLPGFWRGSWRDVVKDMKGRYPRHRWPDEPWTEKPSLKTKNAFARS